MTILKTPCSVPGCPRPAVKGGRCEIHQREPWAGQRGFIGYKGDYLKLRAQVLKEEPICQICFKRPSATVDHIIPVSKGGRTVRGNLRGVCQICHDARSKRQAAEGRARRREG